MEIGNREAARQIIEAENYTKTTDVSGMAFVGQYGGMRIYAKDVTPAVRHGMMLMALDAEWEYYLDISKPHDTVGKPLVNKRKIEDERD
jgi:hypothetical protein